MLSSETTNARIWVRGEKLCQTKHLINSTLSVDCLQDRTSFTVCASVPKLSIFRERDKRSCETLYLYPGPRSFHLFFTAKFCDANRFYYFCYRHEAMRSSAESLWSRPLRISLSCHQLLTVVSDWRIFLIALRVI